MGRIEKMGAMLEAWNSGDMKAYVRLAGGGGTYRPPSITWQPERFRGEERYVAICPDGHRAREEGKSKSRAADNARLYCWSCGKRTAIVREFREGEFREGVRNYVWRAWNDLTDAEREDVFARDEASRGKRR